MTETKEISAYTEFWNDHFQNMPSTGNSDWDARRKSALSNLNAQGFPDNKVEDWKYTSILPLLKNPPTPTIVQNSPTLRKENLEAFVPETDANLLVFYNGFFMSGLSEIREKNIRMGSLRDAVSFGWIPAPEPINENGMTDLNGAFATDGAFLSLDKNEILEKEIIVLFIHDNQGGPASWFCRNQYSLATGASAKITHVYGWLGEGIGMGSLVNEFMVNENAHLKFNQYQTANNPGWWFEHSLLHVGTHASAQSVNLSGGSAFTRNDLHIRLEGKQAEARMFGLYGGSDNGFIDNHTLVDHRVPECFSDEAYKGVLGGKTKAIFNGKVFVRPDAQKTNAFQSNRNLLISEDASIYTKPQLEIFADDVKCSHGATSGQLDAESLFYLRSRGIGEKKARNLLTEAFAAEILEKIEGESWQNLTREFIHSIIQ